jgi:hypothetical protein
MTKARPLLEDAVTGLCTDPRCAIGGAALAEVESMCGDGSSARRPPAIGRVDPA